MPPAARKSAISGCEYPHFALRSRAVVRALALVTLALVAFALPTADAGATSYVPPKGKVLWGGQGGYTRGLIRDFARQSGRKPAVFNYFISWTNNEPTFHWLSFRIADARAEGAAVMLSISPERTRLTPRDLVRGRGDGFLINLAELLAQGGDVTFLRPLSEMNNANNPYAPYDHAGRSRGPAYTVGKLKNAWRRIALIVRGGDVASIDAKLARLHMPAVKTSRAEIPRAPVALMWVPLTFGNPEIEKNHPRHFWPGAAYVDWVGTTWYSPYKRTAAIDSFYRFPRWRKKPFAFAEWGVWGADDPGFVRQFFGFVRSHRRVRMATYYQSASLKPEFRLSTHPRTRAALRAAVRWARLTSVAPVAPVAR
jgi:hypothetical protein